MEKFSVIREEQLLGVEIKKQSDTSFLVTLTSTGIDLLGETSIKFTTDNANVAKLLLNNSAPKIRLEISGNMEEIMGTTSSYGERLVITDDLGKNSVTDTWNQALEPVTKTAEDTSGIIPKNPWEDYPGALPVNTSTTAVPSSRVIQIDDEDDVDDDDDDSNRTVFETSGSSSQVETVTSTSDLDHQSFEIPSNIVDGVVRVVPSEVPESNSVTIDLDKLVVVDTALHGVDITFTQEDPPEHIVGH